jgi:hypothetical protein
MSLWLVSNNIAHALKEANLTYINHKDTKRHKVLIDKTLCRFVSLWLISNNIAHSLTYKCCQVAFC